MSGFPIIPFRDTRQFPREHDRVDFDHPYARGLSGVLIPTGRGFVDLIDGFTIPLTGGWIYRVERGQRALVHNGANTCYAESTRPKYLIGGSTYPRGTVLVFGAFSNGGNVSAVVGFNNGSGGTSTERLNLQPEMYFNTNNYGIMFGKESLDWNSGIALPNNLPVGVGFYYDTTGTSGVTTLTAEASRTTADSANVISQIDIGCVYRAGFGYTDRLQNNDAIFAIYLYSRCLTNEEIREVLREPGIFIAPEEVTWFKGAAAGSTYSKSVAGSITGVGGLTKKTMKTLAGAVAPAGAVAKKTAKPLVGSSAAAGAITKKTFKVFSGSATPSGTVTERIVFVLAVAGSITASGTIAKTIKKGLVGALTATGAIAKKTSKQVGGAITAAGALARKTAKKIAGSVAPGGSLATVYRTAKSVAGSITMSGAVNGVKIVLVAAARKTRRLLMSFLQRR